MTQIDAQVLESVNKPGRVGVLATADKDGRPNAGYFGSPHLNPEGELIMGLGNCRTLANLDQNPLAVFFTVETAPVGMDTPGWRLYLEAEEVQRQGPILDGIRAAVAARAGEKAALGMKAGVRFRVTEVRPLVDMG